MKVLYFAWLRTRAGLSEAEVSPPPGVTDVAGLIEWLKGQGEGHAAALGEPRLVRVAVNQVHVGPDHPLKPGDEVAFFPPVTGGGAAGGGR
ncbi:MAG: molybdopterin converting factor subunit 1 [Proteobacteria bacterium]|nr:molybdopterin converting factor subunit 1 [Pseudomonadota bacterium]